MSIADASTQSLWSTLSNVGFVMVIAGVVLEGAEILARLIARRSRRGGAEKAPPVDASHNIPEWAHRIGDIGWGVLVIGLALEFCGHIRLTEISDRENAALTKQLERTTKLAGEAIERAASNDLARVELETRLGELRYKNEELEYLQLPRTFKQNPALVMDALKVFAGTPFLISTEASSDRVINREIIGLSAEAHMLVRGAGWRHIGSVSETNGPLGVRIRVTFSSEANGLTHTNDVESAAVALYNVIRASGIAAVHDRTIKDGRIITNGTGNCVAIHVGRKFPPDDDKSVRGWWRVPQSTNSPSLVVPPPARSSVQSTLR